MTTETRFSSRSCRSFGHGSFLPRCELTGFRYPREPPVQKKNYNCSLVTTHPTHESAQLTSQRICTGEDNNQQQPCHCSQSSANWSVVSTAPVLCFIIFKYLIRSGCLKKQALCVCKVKIILWIHLIPASTKVYYYNQHVIHSQCNSLSPNALHNT